MNSETVKPKLADIAEQAGVSVSTVSQVLNGRGRIADATRKIVLAAADSLNYRKNSSRVTSRAVNSIPIAALVNTGKEWNFLWNFERILLNIIEDNLAGLGFSLIFIPVRPDNTTQQILEKISTSGASAVFPMHYGNDELFTHLQRMGLPVTVIFNNSFNNRFPAVSVNDFGCAYNAVSYLRKLGHHSICFADCPMENLESTNRERLSGFKAGISGQKMHVLRFGRFDRDGLRNKLVSMLQLSGTGANTKSTGGGKKKNGPTAFFAVDDDAALRIYYVITEMGYGIPEDISIIAPGDVLDYSLPSTPSLTTMQVDLESAGRTAAEMMDHLLRGRDSRDGTTAVSITAPYRLIDRGSCGPPGDAAARKKNTEEPLPQHVENKSRLKNGTTIRSRRKTT